MWFWASLPISVVNGVILVAYNQSWWEYLHLRTWKSYKSGLGLLFSWSSRFKQVMEKIFITQIKPKNFHASNTKNWGNTLPVLKNHYIELSKNLFTSLMNEWSSDIHLSCVTFNLLVNRNKIITQHLCQNWAHFSVATIGLLQIWNFKKATCENESAIWS